MSPALSLFSGRARLLLGLAAAVLALAVLFVVAARLTDPFGWRAARLEAAETAATAARLESTARTIEVEGERAAARRAESAHRVRLETRVATAEAAAQARSAPDATQPLDPDRAARLRAHDRRLCERVPAACAAAAPGHAGPGG